jgi:hypothetical protein
VFSTQSYKSSDSSLDMRNDGLELKFETLTVEPRGNLTTSTSVTEFLAHTEFEVRIQFELLGSTLYEKERRILLYFAIKSQILGSLFQVARLRFKSTLFFSSPTMSLNVFTFLRGRLSLPFAAYSSVTRQPIYRAIMETTDHKTL